MRIQGDLLIHGGTVVDPARGYYGKGDIVVQNGKIIDGHSGETVETENAIDATGHLVLPGLIDHHTHVFPGGTSIGVYPDSAHLPQGVTTVVDQGSSGSNNCEGFINSIVTNSQTRIFAHVHVSPAGLATLPRSFEPVDPKIFDLASIRNLFHKHSKCLIGLKIRQSREIVGQWGLAPLEAAVRIADAIGCKVAVHTTDPPTLVDELAALLRPGDVFTHMYQGKGNNIIEDKGYVRQAIRDARSRGIVFETADGRGHCAFHVAKDAIADCFEPDIISTDLVKASLYEKTVFGLPLIMSKYLCLGISLNRVVEACTSAPARVMGMEGKIGTLAPGAYADIAIFQLREKPLTLKDVFGSNITCNQVFIPRMTVLNGRVVYRSLEF